MSDPKTPDEYNQERWKVVLGAVLVPVLCYVAFAIFWIVLGGPALP